MKRSTCTKQVYLDQSVAENTARLLRSKGIRASAWPCCVKACWHVSTTPRLDEVPTPVRDTCVRSKPYAAALAGQQKILREIQKRFGQVPRKARA